MSDELARKTRRHGKSNSAGGRWPQIEATTLADRVYQIVRNRILHREIAPGSFIREQEVSRATGVSRTPVREALNRLASQEFLERVPHRGFRVPDRPWETLLDVYPIVSALELLAASLAFEQMTPADVRKLKDLNRGLERAGQEGDAKAGVEFNNAFHRTFSDRSGNARLGELLDQLRAQVVLLDIWYFSIPENVKRSVEEHDDVVESLEEGNAKAALQGLKLNYTRGGEALHRELIRKTGSPPV